MISLKLGEEVDPSTRTCLIMFEYKKLRLLDKKEVLVKAGGIKDDE